MEVARVKSLLVQKVQKKEGQRKRGISTFYDVNSLKTNSWHLKKHGIPHPKTVVQQFNFQVCNSAFARVLRVSFSCPLAYH